MPWLLKAEPNSRIVKGVDVKYTVDDLKREHVASWDGVRNNEARKHMCAMKTGDRAFFYRSNCADPGIVGTMRVVKEAHPDRTASDPSEPYYDAKNPEGKWVVVDFEYETHIEPPVLLSSIKANPKLQNMSLVKRSRLSVSPVASEEWDVVMQMARASSQPAQEDQETTTTHTTESAGERNLKRDRTNGKAIGDTESNKEAPKKRRLRRRD